LLTTMAVQAPRNCISPTWVLD